MVWKEYEEKMKEWVSKSFIRLFAFMIFIGITRQMLELIGWFTGSDNYHGIYLTIPSFMNTIVYVFLMIIAEGYLINFILKGDRKHLRALIKHGSFLLLYLFILIPVLNNIFNYHFFKLPIYYDLSFISPMLFQHYGPAGIIVAFILVIFYFPIWLKKIYKTSYLERLKAVLIVYVSHFIVYYQLAMMFCFGSLRKFNFFTNTAVNLYTNTYLLPVIFLYPFFMQKYARNKSEYRQMFLIYIILWVIFISLFLW